MRLFKNLKYKKLDYFDFLSPALLLATTGLQENYRNSFLGMAWSMISPAVNILVLSIVFSIVLRIDMTDYPLYLMSGMLAWTTFTNILNICSYSLISRGETLKRSIVSFIIFPFSDSLTQLYIFMFSLFQCK